MFPTVHFHPMVVHFPIALLLMGLLFEVLNVFYKDYKFLSMAAAYLLVFGAIAAIAAWATGQLFTGEMEGAAGEIKDSHELFALITMITSVITALLYTWYLLKPPAAFNLRWIVFALYCLVGIAVAVTGYYGGILVYEYMLPL